MLWQYIEIMFAMATLATILAFYKNIDRVGNIFFLLVGAVFWFGFGVSLLKRDFKFKNQRHVWKIKSEVEGELNG